ncbi:unnamed protein product [Closterium sp. NIES-53]
MRYDPLTTPYAGRPRTVHRASRASLSTSIRRFPPFSHSRSGTPAVSPACSPAVAPLFPGPPPRVVVSATPPPLPGSTVPFPPSLLFQPPSTPLNSPLPLSTLLCSVLRCRPLPRASRLGFTLSPTCIVSHSSTLLPPRSAPRFPPPRRPRFPPFRLPAFPHPRTTLRINASPRPSLPAISLPCVAPSLVASSALPSSVLPASSLPSSALLPSALPSSARRSSAHLPRSTLSSLHTTNVFLLPSPPPLLPPLSPPHPSFHLLPSPSPSTVSALTSLSDVTILLPLSPEVLSFMRTAFSPAKRDQILAFHVITKRYSYVNLTTLPGGTELETLEGMPLIKRGPNFQPLTLFQGRELVPSLVIVPNIFVGSTFSIHGISTVLIPPDL